MGITFGLIYDKIRWEEKAIIETAKLKGIPINLIDSKISFFELTGNEEKKSLGDVLLQRCISFFRGLHITATLESQGYPVVNSYDVTNVCGNKLLTTMALSKAKIPTPKTFVAFTPEGAYASLEKLGYPAILKPVVGSWGRLIVPLKDAETAMAIFEEREFMYPIYQIFYIQKIVKRPPRDMRIFVAGDEVIAGIYRYSFLDIKTNIARGGKAEVCKITREIEDLSLKAADAIGGGILGVDLMETDEGLVVHEVNHTLEFQAMVAATKINIPKYIIGYLIRKAKK